MEREAAAVKGMNDAAAAAASDRQTGRLSTCPGSNCLTPKDSWGETPPTQSAGEAGTEDEWLDLPIYVNIESN